MRPHKHGVKMRKRHGRRKPLPTDANLVARRREVMHLEAVAVVKMYQPGLSWDRCVGGHGRDGYPAVHLYPRWGHGAGGLVFGIAGGYERRGNVLRCEGGLDVCRELAAVRGGHCFRGCRRRRVSE